MVVVLLMHFVEFWVGGLGLVWNTDGWIPWVEGKGSRLDNELYEQLN